MTDKQLYELTQWLYDEANAVRSTGTKIGNMEEYLRRHLPAPTVVEVTGEDLTQTDALYAPVRADQINARLRARATTDTIPVRVIRRPSETVSVYDAMIASGAKDEQQFFGILESGVFQLGRVHPILNGRDDMARWSFDGTTWYSRTQQPRAWQAGDVPDGNTVMLWQETGATGFVYHRSVGEDFIARQANERNATAILVLPEVLND